MPANLFAACHGNGTSLRGTHIRRKNRLVIQSDGPRFEMMRPARLVVIVLLDYRKTRISPL